MQYNRITPMEGPFCRLLVSALPYVATYAKIKRRKQLKTQMKKKKDRVVALDYFRGICILIILLSHSAQFSYPIAYLSGMGLLWTSAAEMFFLLSGITLGVVRN